MSFHPSVVGRLVGWLVRVNGRVRCGTRCHDLLELRLVARSFAAYLCRPGLPSPWFVFPFLVSFSRFVFAVWHEQSLPVVL